MPPSTKALLKAAKSHLDSCDPKAALAILTPLRASDPSNYNAHVLAGVAYIAESDLSAGLSAYSAAIALRPEASLAHKGVKDAVKRLGGHEEHALMYARACAVLGVELGQAAKVLYTIAGQEVGLRKEALGLLERVIGEDCGGNVVRDTFAWMGVDLGLKMGGDVSEVFVRGLMETLKESSVFVGDEVVDYVLGTVVGKIKDGVDVEQGVAFLKNIGAWETLLELYENGIVNLRREEVEMCGVRVLHLDPRSVGRGSGVVAAEIGDGSIALGLAGVSNVKRRKVSGTSIRCLVCAWMHLRRGEGKLAVEVAKQGRDMVRKGSIWACLSLLLGRALAGERKFKDSVKEFEVVRLWASGEGDEWAVNAANRGLVETAVFAHGRSSRHAAMAVEEAAGSSVNSYGVLECVWTEALGNDVDCERMEQLVSTAVENMKSGERANELVWEYAVLDEMFGVSVAELASVGASRLGQMLVKQYGVEKDVLERAQRWHMDAAGIFKGSPNPFAHLGWIFERLGETGNGERMISRAMRCYEKALSIDVAHPLASRRLVRLLKQKGFMQDAAEVARRVVEKNPKSRWANNAVGWYGVERASYHEAVIAFRNALRGKSKMYSRAEEVLFGTDVGRTEEDNDLVVDVDSWRGLSSAYRRQGKIGPAVSCMDDALALVRKPPHCYTVGTLFDIGAFQDSLGILLEGEKGVLQQLNKQSEEAIPNIESILSDSRAPLTLKSYLCESYLHEASKEWLCGSYNKATELRTKAVEILRAALEEQGKHETQLNPSSTFKRIGDILMESVTSHPKLVDKILPANYTHTMVSDALIAYCRALHFSPWQNKPLRQDITAALLKLAVLDEDEKLARQAVDLQIANEGECAVLAVSFLTLAMMTTCENMGAAASHIAAKVSNSDTSKKHLVALNSSIALQAACIGEIYRGADSAVAAIRHDPTDWCGWFAVGAIREADAKKHDWPYEMIRSSEDAFMEADRLGGGPCAVHGVVRCLTALLQARKQFDLSREEMYKEACFCTSMAARIGLEEPTVCSEIIDGHVSVMYEDAKKRVRELVEAHDTTNTLRHVHLYPFIPEVATMDLLAL